MIPIDDRLAIELRLSDALPPEMVRCLVDRLDRDPILAQSMADTLEHRWDFSEPDGPTTRPHSE